MRQLITILFLLTSLYSDNMMYHSDAHIEQDLSNLNLAMNKKEKLRKILQEFREKLNIHRNHKHDNDQKNVEMFSKGHFSSKEMEEINNNYFHMLISAEIKLLEKIHTVLDEKERVEFINYFDDWRIQ